MGIVNNAFPEGSAKGQKSGSKAMKLMLNRSVKGGFFEHSKLDSSSEDAQLTGLRADGYDRHIC